MKITQMNTRALVLYARRVKKKNSLTVICADVVLVRKRLKITSFQKSHKIKPKRFSFGYFLDVFFSVVVFSHTYLHNAIHKLFQLKIEFMVFMVNHLFVRCLLDVW